MDAKGIFEKVAIAILTTIVLGVGGFFMGIFEKGNAAISKEQITEVVNEILVTESGQTVKARIAEVNGELDVLESRASRMEKDIDDAEQAILDLAGRR